MTIGDVKHLREGRARYALTLVVALASSWAVPAAANGQIEIGDSEFDCLALNVYHEARGEPVEGQLAVAVVTLNRVRDPQFPDSICAVVWQRGQFSWTHDGRPDRPYEQAAWEVAKQVAQSAWRGQTNVGRATYFHSTGVNPFWVSERRRVARVGRHVFYE